MSKTAWVIILYGLSTLLFLFMAVGPWVGVAASGRTLPFAFLFLAAGHFVQVMPP